MTSLPLHSLAAAIGFSVASLLAAPLTLAGPLTPNAVAVTEIAESPAGRYLIVFDEPGLLDYKGSIAGLQRTAPVAGLGASRKFDAGTSAARSYSAYLANQRNARLAAIEQQLRRPLTIAHSYDVTRHAISAELSLDEARAIAGLAGIQSISPVRIHQPETFRGPAFIGAPSIWDGSQVPSYATATRGEGIRVGVIDSGANSAHPSFANDAACGFSATNPKLIAKDCLVSNTSGCSGVTPQADAGIGHGVHTASTAAGNTVDASATPAPLLPTGMAISGVAPCAAVTSYKICGAAGCFDDAIAAAIQNAITDQVDVVNYSIGPTCGYGSPWQASEDLDFLSALSSDVFVAASAGNTRSNCTEPAGRVANIAPWVTTVAASTNDLQLASSLTVSGPGTPSPLLHNMALRTGTTTLPPEQTSSLVGMPLRLYPGNISGCTNTGAFPPGYFNGSIAIVQRHVCSFAEKISNAANSGARMVIVVNNGGTVFGMDTTGAPATIAAFNISDHAISDALIAFVAGNPGVIPIEDSVFSNGFDASLAASGDYSPMALLPQQGDVLADFSFRGPVPSPLSNLTKPDITAPGVNIYAATDPASGHYMFESGTSMSSPHVAGAAALLRKVQPDWSVSEVKSALMTTASVIGFKEDGITPWDPDDVGSGRVDLTKAARAGLTLDENPANYLAANPAGGTVNLTALNLPSLRNIKCGEHCSWTRTFRNRLATTGSWTVAAEQPDGYTLQFSPATFALAAGATQTVTVTATVNDITLPSGLSFGRVLLHESNGRSPDQHLPVAVQGDQVSVACTGSDCSLRIDNFMAGYSAIGCDTFCSFVWANRYSPAATHFPITLRTITFLTGSSSYVSAGDRYDFYVYQDNDRDPTNGATLVGSQKGYTITTAGARLRTLALTTPIVLNGPGDIVIALTNPSGSGPRPAGGEISEFRGRSYAGNYDGEDPDLGSAAVGLQLNPGLINFSGNFVIRATGTTSAGQQIELDEASPKGNTRY